MIKIYPYEELGQADYGWLKACYHFSFGQYFNPERTGFGDLLVVNDDIVRPGAGFDPHSHRNMEIITYVRRGAITHEDSLGNKGRTEAGDVQVMSAGSGIRHAEYNRETEETSLYQIWIKPHTQNVAPRWETRRFPREPANGALLLLVSGRGEDSREEGVLFIHADARIYGGRLRPGSTITQPVSGKAYLLVSDGQVTVDGEPLKKGDGAEIRDAGAVSLAARNGEAEILLIDLIK